MATTHPQYLRAERAIGIWSEPGKTGGYAAGWAVRSGETKNQNGDYAIDLWVVDEFNRLPKRPWQAATHISTLRPSFVCVHPVEVVGQRRDGTDYYDPIDYGLALAVKSMTPALGMGIGYRRSEEARRSVLNLLIDSDRVRFEGRAEQFSNLPDQHRKNPTEDTTLVYRAVAALTSSASTADYQPAVTSWQTAAKVLN